LGIRTTLNLCIPTKYTIAFCVVGITADVVPTWVMPLLNFWVIYSEKKGKIKTAGELGRLRFMSFKDCPYCLNARGAPANTAGRSLESLI